ncbi:MAG: hypothetical protein IPM45_00360 [Acidimicrobiales bacterium]|nr:hypothetical protein [Acidimicrobiales bacterium]
MIEIGPDEHRRLAMALNQRAWQLLETASRSLADDEEMVDAAHGSAYHWRYAEGASAVHQARGAWLISRAYAVLGHGEEARRHAERCLAICTEYVISDYDLAYAHEALARAEAAAGDLRAATRHRRAAAEAGRAIADPDDRAAFEADLAAPPWFGLT